MPANLRTCADCSTQYALDVPACPHCGSTNSVDEEGAVMQRLPLFVTVSCPDCGRGPWTVRLNSVKSGLLELPTLACASCGSRVPVTWPLKEDPMPKNHVGRAPTDSTDVRDADSSPAAVTDEAAPPVTAEDDRGAAAPEADAVPAPEPADGGDSEDKAEPKSEGGAVDPYEGLTLSELKAEADTRNVPSYGTKAQITDRLREADAAVAAKSKE
jgi:hypothetical protein